MGPEYSDVSIATNATISLQAAFPNDEHETISTFWSNAVPAYVELELGILEPETMRQYYTMLRDENPNATTFLSRQIAKVHLYRRRIPIRTAAQ